VPPVQLYNRRWNAPPPVTRELWTGEALVIVVTVAMPPAIMIPIAMPINATPLQAANHPAGWLRPDPPIASILVTYHSNLSNLIDAVVAPERIQRHGRCAGRNGDTTAGSCQDDDLVGHRDDDDSQTVASTNSCSLSYGIRLALTQDSASPHRPGCPNRHHLAPDQATENLVWLARDA
jgi:hypothetical protein